MPSHEHRCSAAMHNTAITHGKGACTSMRQPHNSKGAHLRRLGQAAQAGLIGHFGG
jgi:hypothetical protein